MSKVNVYTPVVNLLLEWCSKREATGIIMFMTLNIITGWPTVLNQGMAVYYSGDTAAKSQDDRMSMCRQPSVVDSGWWTMPMSSTTSCGQRIGDDADNGDRTLVGHCLDSRTNTQSWDAQRKRTQSSWIIILLNTVIIIGEKPQYVDTEINSLINTELNRYLCIYCLPQ